MTQAQFGYGRQQVERRIDLDVTVTDNVRYETVQGHDVFQIIFGLYPIVKGYVLERPVSGVRQQNEKLSQTFSLGVSIIWKTETIEPTVSDPQKKK